MSGLGFHPNYTSSVQSVDKVESAQIRENFKKINDFYIKIFSVLLLFSFFYCFIDAVFFRKLSEKFYLPLIYVSVFLLAIRC